MVKLTVLRQLAGLHCPEATARSDTTKDGDHWSRNWVTRYVVLLL